MLSRGGVFETQIIREKCIYVPDGQPISTERLMYTGHVKYCTYALEYMPRAASYSRQVDSACHKGHCTCKTITYEVLAPFLCTNCCHCTWCQRETGAAYALNAIIETSNFRITSETKPIIHDLPTNSGNGQKHARCPKCYVVIASDYGGDFTWTTFVKVGTLDDESEKKGRPDVHIYTATKMDWVDLTAEKERGIPVLEAGSKAVDVWSKDALERLEVLKQKMKEAEENKESSKSTNDS